MKKVLTIMSIILAILVIGACSSEDLGNNELKDSATAIEQEEGQINDEQKDQEETQQILEDSQEVKEPEQSEQKDETPVTSQEKEEIKEEESQTTSSQPPQKEEISDNSASVIVPEQEDTIGNLVWVPVNGGTKYHSKESCSNMKDPKQVTKEHAEQNGYTACKRCY